MHCHSIAASMGGGKCTCSCNAPGGCHAHKFRLQRQRGTQNMRRLRQNARPIPPLCTGGCPGLRPLDAHPSDAMAIVCRGPASTAKRRARNTSVPPTRTSAVRWLRSPSPSCPCVP